MVGEHPDRFQGIVGEQVGLVDFSDRRPPDYPSDLRLHVDYMFAMLGFEVGDTPVLEAQVGAGGVEAFVQGAVVGGELADTLLECGVLGGDALDRVLGPFGFQVADAAEQLADPCPLGDDLVVRGLERVLGVERTFAPARLTAVALLVLEAVSLGGLPDGFGDSGFRVRVGVEEGPGHALLTELKRKSPHVNGDVAVSGVTVTARDRRW